MAGDGKRLEILVAFIEESLGPVGVSVERNEKVWNTDGAQLAELDVVVSGKFGSTDFRWLIECRDRPSEGAAPVSWIEQLATRRQIHGFHKITAVSTTGFSGGAEDVAKQTGVELREVVSLEPESFKRWLGLEFVEQVESFHKINHAHILISPTESVERQAAVGAIVAAQREPFLRAEQNGEIRTTGEAFIAAIKGMTPNPFEGLELNGEPRTIDQIFEYPASDRFVIDTEFGCVPVNAIRFVGEVSLRQRFLRISDTAEYRGVNGETISQTVRFMATEVMGQRVEFEMHHIASTGQTYLGVLREPLEK